MAGPEWDWKQGRFYRGGEKLGRQGMGPGHRVCAGRLTQPVCRQVGSDVTCKSRSVLTGPGPLQASVSPINAAPGALEERVFSHSPSRKKQGKNEKLQIGCPCGLQMAFVSTEI